jgi:hypothetical protein
MSKTHEPRYVSGKNGKTVILVGAAYFQTKSGKMYRLTEFDDQLNDFVKLDEKDVLSPAGGLTSPSDKVAIYSDDTAVYLPDA